MRFALDRTRLLWSGKFLYCALFTLGSLFGLTRYHAAVLAKLKNYTCILFQNKLWNSYYSFTEQII